MSEELRAAGLAPVTVRQCDIDRLKRKVEKVRDQRDKYRARAEHAEWLIERGRNAWIDEQRKAADEAHRNALWRLESEVRRLKGVIADKVIERLAPEPDAGTKVNA